MIGRRAAAAGIATKLGNHSFRATGITAYLKNGGTLEKAAAMASHASTRRRDELRITSWRLVGIVVKTAAAVRTKIPVSVIHGHFLREFCEVQLPGEALG